MVREFKKNVARIIALLVAVFVFLSILPISELVFAETENHPNAVTITVVDENGAPVTGAKVTYSVYSTDAGTNVLEETDVSVDANGEIVVMSESDFETYTAGDLQLNATATADGYEDINAVNSTVDTIIAGGTDNYTIKLQEEINPNFQKTDSNNLVYNGNGIVIATFSAKAGDTVTVWVNDVIEPDFNATVCLEDKDFEITRTDAGEYNIKVEVQRDNHDDKTVEDTVTIAPKPIEGIELIGKQLEFQEDQDGNPLEQELVDFSSYTPEEGDKVYWKIGETSEYEEKATDYIPTSAAVCAGCSISVRVVRNNGNELFEQTVTDASIALGELNLGDLIIEIDYDDNGELKYKTDDDKKGLDQSLLKITGNPNNYMLYFITTPGQSEAVKSNDSEDWKEWTDTEYPSGKNAGIYTTWVKVSKYKSTFDEDEQLPDDPDTEEKEYPFFVEIKKAEQTISVDMDHQVTYNNSGEIICKFNGNIPVEDVTGDAVDVEYTIEEGTAEIVKVEGTYKIKYMQTGTIKVCATIKERPNYNEKTSDPFEITISYADFNEDDIVITPNLKSYYDEEKDVLWADEKGVTISANGWVISRDNSLGQENGWEASIKELEHPLGEDYFVAFKNTESGNITDKINLNDRFAIDGDSPVIENFSFRATNNTPIDRILNFLTFGLCFNSEIEVTVTASDQKGSGIQTIDLYYGGSQTPSQTKSNGDINIVVDEDPNSILKYTATFTLDPADFKKMTALSANAYDYLSHDTTKTKVNTSNSWFRQMDEGTILIDELKPEIKITVDNPIFTDESERNWYGDDVTFNVTVTDVDKVDEENSGIRSINATINGDPVAISGFYADDSYEAENKIEPISDKEYILDQNTSSEQIVKIDSNSSNYYFFDSKNEEIHFSITTDISYKNENDNGDREEYKLEINTVDNAGNPHQSYKTIYIDRVAPRISVDFDEVTFSGATYNDLQCVGNDQNRKATITITESNFNNDDVKITLTRDGDPVPVSLDFENVSQAVDQNGDAIWTTVLDYKDLVGSDGNVFDFEIECSDKLGHTTSDEKVTYNDAKTFVIDNTKPKITVDITNSDVKNGKYFKADRTATVTIKERFFSKDYQFDWSGLTLKNSGAVAKAPTPVLISSDSKTYTHVYKIDFTAEGDYTFDVKYQDLADNLADTYTCNSVAYKEFTIDKTNPALSISGIADNSANADKGNIGFTVSATDTNFDVFEPVITAVRYIDGKFETSKINPGTTADIANGRQYKVTNIDTDGIYRITCTVVDKAGNAFSEVVLEDASGNKYTKDRSGDDVLVTFSVNRDGSVFYVDGYTEKLLKSFYVQNVTENVQINEVNADTIVEKSITVNGKTLVEGDDYSVSLDKSDGTWYKYIYSIKASVFEKEGEYNIVIFSKDRADNQAYSDIKNVTAKFVVDRTAPTVTIAGIQTDGRYRTDKQVVTVVPSDDGGLLKKLIIRTVDENGNVIKELINLEGDALLEAVAAGNITFELTEGLYQNVQIICEDAAGNISGENASGEIYKNVSVSTNVFLIFWANKVARYLTIAGLVVVLGGAAAFLIFKKKKA